MIAFDVVEIVGPGKEISCKGAWRPAGAVGCRDGSQSGAGAGTPNHDSARRVSRNKRQALGDRHGGGCSQMDMSAAKSKNCNIHEGGRKNMRFPGAEQLGSQGEWP